jgi:hypothetical protein
MNRPSVQRPTRLRVERPDGRYRSRVQPAEALGPSVFQSPPGPPSPCCGRNGLRRLRMAAGGEEHVPAAMAGRTGE